MENPEKKAGKAGPFPGPGRAATRLQTLAPGERDKLAAIMSRLSSSHDGERAAAALLASAFVAKHGLEWSDVIGSLRPVEAAPAVPSGPPPQQDRRRGASKTWYGYSRRKLVQLGQALNWLS